MTENIPRQQHIETARRLGELLGKDPAQRSLLAVLAVTAEAPSADSIVGEDSTPGL
jgi:hypothetical protein